MSVKEFETTSIQYKNLHGLGGAVGQGTHLGQLTSASSVGGPSSIPPNSGILAKAGPIPLFLTRTLHGPEFITP